MPGAGTGPFETHDQVASLPSVRAMYDAMRNCPRGTGTASKHRLLESACAEADVDLGAYDHQTLAWLAGLDPQPDYWRCGSDGHPEVVMKDHRRSLARPASSGS